MEETDPKQTVQEDVPVLPYPTPAHVPWKELWPRGWETQVLVPVLPLTPRVMLDRVFHL